MFPRSLVVLIALCASAKAFAQPAYAPKFARQANKTASAPVPVAVDSPAGVLYPASCPKPPYPKASLRNEETGATTITVHLAPTGDVNAAATLRSSGFPNLDAAAVQALRNCMFKPAIVNGVQVESSLNMQYVWTLN